MASFINQLSNVINRMDPRHWVLVLGCVIIVGFVLLKGVGSRANY